MNDPKHNIRFVSNHTGLSQHTIRAWERRYAALSPDRTTTNRRLYSAEDMEKLSLLRRAVQAGHSIGRIAGLTVPQLRGLEMNEVQPSVQAPRPVPVNDAASPPAAQCLSECLLAVERLDAEGLEDALSRAAALLGAAAMIDRVLLPLLHGIGERWREGEIRPAHEHMASAIVRTFLGRMLDAYQPASQAPQLIVTTPAGQLHELGALIAAVAAASEGWRVLYLGPNLPAEEIAGAALGTGARAVALSIVYPPDDARLGQELASLRKMLGTEIRILAGGRASAAYRPSLEAINALHIPELQILRAELETLRAR